MRSAADLRTAFWSHLATVGRAVTDRGRRREVTNARYWSAQSDQQWKTNAHWRDAAGGDWSEIWAEVGATHVHMYERLARAVELPRPARILEWGVGGGANAVAFAPLCDEFIAVDIVQESLDETARQVAAVCDTPVERVLVALDDQAHGTDHLSASVDLFLCFYVLELVPSARHAREIVDIAMRLLRPGGVAILQTKYRRSAPRWKLWKAFGERLANQYTVEIAPFWELLMALGFEVVAGELTPSNRLDRHYAYYFTRRPQDPR